MVYLFFAAVINDATVNTFEFAFWCISVQLYTWDGITWPEGLHIFSFSQYCPTVLQNDCYIFYAPATEVRILVALSFCMRLVSSLFNLRHWHV